MRKPNIPKCSFIAGQYQTLASKMALTVSNQTFVLIMIETCILDLIKKILISLTII